MSIVGISPTDACSSISPRTTAAPTAPAPAVTDTLSRMESLSSEHHARLAVVALPTAAQVYAQEPFGGNYDTALPQAYLQSFCRERDIPYLDLLPLLRQQAAASNKRLYLNRDIHLTEFGHARVGELIAAWFQSKVRR